jgi:hypothetical protein
MLSVATLSHVLRQQHIVQVHDACLTLVSLEDIVPNLRTASGVISDCSAQNLLRWQHVLPGARVNSFAPQRECAECNHYNQT